MNAIASEFKPKYVLALYLDSPSDQIEEKYKVAIRIHNANVKESDFPDSGFDIYTPESTIDMLNASIHKQYNVVSCHTIKVDMKVKASMYKVENEGMSMRPSGYYMYARSSISKTCVRLANNQGIIDSGYRGNLIGMFDILKRECSHENFERNHRLVQICAPTLEPFTIKLVTDIKQLGTTLRGEGGFGSTGST